MNEGKREHFYRIFLTRQASETPNELAHFRAQLEALGLQIVEMESTDSLQQQLSDMPECVGGLASWIRGALEEGDLPPAWAGFDGEHQIIEAAICASNGTFDVKQLAAQIQIAIAEHTDGRNAEFLTASLIGWVYGMM